VPAIYPLQRDFRRKSHTATCQAARSRGVAWSHFVRVLLHGTQVKNLKFSTGVSFTRRHVNVTEHDVAHDWNMFQSYLTQSNIYNDLQFSQVAAVLPLYITTITLFFGYNGIPGKSNFILQHILIVILWMIMSSKVSLVNCFYLKFSPDWYRNSFSLPLQSATKGMWLTS